MVLVFCGKSHCLILLSFLTIPDTDRACAVKVSVGRESLICVNMYMPIDNQRKTYVDNEFLETLDVIEMFLEQRNERHIVLTGDMNLDYARGNAHDVYFRDFINRHGLIDSFDLDVADKGFTYHDPNNGCFTCIDHFSINSGLCDCVLGVDRYDMALNPSKHLPVILNINVQIDHTHVEDSDSKIHEAPISWHKVSEIDEQKYRTEQDWLLDTDVIIPEVADCADVKCCDVAHQKQIDIWCEQLVDVCLKADAHLPRVKEKKSKKPLWKEDVKPYRDDCLWWHNFWIQCGKPTSGVVYESKRESKRQYMYAVRRNRRKEEQLRRERMSEAICNNRSRDFYTEMKKLNPKQGSAPSINGHVKTNDIAAHFADKYEQLYNSVPSDGNSLEKIKSYIQENIAHCDESDRLVSQADVAKVIQQLKMNKSDGDRGLMSNHLQMSSEKFRNLLAKLITAILTHGYQPKSVLLGTIASIPKDSKGNICTDKNYRGITLCSSISKLIDVLIILRYKDLLQTSDMQYAYKENHSTVMCNLMTKEVIHYYLNNQSDVYACFVDATKAFDRVRHDKLFDLLIDRKLPVIVLRALFDMYERQSMRTVWKGSLSREFSACNGIRQGGVVSPVLFCVYMDGLLNRLQKEGIGCWIGGHYFGAQGYADDLKLLVPTSQGLQKMLLICEEFGAEYGVEYNPVKTVCMVFSRKERPKPCVKLNGTELKWVESVKDLGNIMDANMSEKSDVKRKKGDLVQRVNNLIVTLGGSRDVVIQKVFNTQCCHLYGTPAWNFSDASIDEFRVMWNRSVRRILQLPYTTHTRYLPSLMGTCNIMDQIYMRFMKMLSVMLNSENSRVKHLTAVSISNPRSIIGGNVRVIMDRLQIMDQETVISQGASLLKQINRCELSEHDHAALGLIRELRGFICGRYVINGFNKEDVNDMLNFICTV